MTRRYKQHTSNPPSDEIGPTFQDYQFKDKALLELALTHRSAGRNNNERLEFLGDALLDLVIAEYLFRNFAEADEGQLTRTRALLVNRQHLATVARRLQIPEKIQLGEGERKSGGWRRDSILANVLEAIIGAVYLDGGIDSCRICVERWFDQELKATDPTAALKDAKTTLQEYLQARNVALPQYAVADTCGPAHATTFIVICEVPAYSLKVEASGSSRRSAEQEAARKALAQLRSRHG